MQQRSCEPGFIAMPQPQLFPSCILWILEHTSLLGSPNPWSQGEHLVLLGFPNPAVPNQKLASDDVIRTNLLNSSRLKTRLDVLLREMLTFYVIRYQKLLKINKLKQKRGTNATQEPSWSRTNSRKSFNRSACSSDNYVGD